MQILIHEQDADPTIVTQVVREAIRAGNGNLHVKVAGEGIVKLRGASLGSYAVSPGGPLRWFVTDRTGNLVYLDDTDWIEGYEGR